ncbi:hypothetical protein Q5P01_009795 [Channa striata]|uniref:Ig-like domain-containing protein n=1 Tax=Channa striata TaxID=64152 RepID=A0AA88N1H4_CHASR|nr:hypothetical protein Q5P01_009795 [Channa striata]
MRCSGLLILVLVLNVAHCLETRDQTEEVIIEISPNITAVLGGEVNLSCRYVGEGELERADWYRHSNSKGKSKGMIRLKKRGEFSRFGVSGPDSHNNLTVRMNVDSVESEGEYICQFESEEQVVSDSTFVTVVAQPDIQILVSAETRNRTHYQSVSCSAVGGRPTPQISWSVRGFPVSDPPFTVSVTETVHSNGTSTLSSVLRFPTHLQDEDSVTCEVQHPTLPSPKLTTVRVETFARPNVTIKAEMVQREGKDFWVVSCISSGGKPDTDISLALDVDEELEGESDADSDTHKRSFYLLATAYEGRNVTCVFAHPKFPHRETRGLTLPSFYLSGVHLLGINNDESLELREGQRDTVLSLQVTGNVPRHNITCKKDDGPLPEDIRLVDSSLTVQAPVERHHAGLYECVVSYHHLEAVLQFNVTVVIQVTLPVPPTIRVALRTEHKHQVIECSAADAVPEANVSWLLPEGVSGVSWFNSTSHNGSHSVRGSLLLPACLPWELTAECMINHPAFEKPENRSIKLPLCARPNITINSSTVWEGDRKYTKVDCSADSVAAAVTWHAGNGDIIISPATEAEVHADGSVSARGSVRFLSSLYAGQNLTCMVEHPSLQAPERRTIHIPVRTAPLLSVSVMRQHDSHLWLAVCECTGEDVGTNLTWILPDGPKGQTSLQSKHEGRAMNVRLTYQFPLALHEGKNLTCVYQFDHGITEKRSVHVPRYYISAVRVLNHTTPLRSRYGGKPFALRLTLEEKHHNQKILLQVEGNASQYELSCKRSDGSFVHMEGLAMVFQSELTEQDAGVYTCQATFYHHMATVNIQVEVMSEETHTALATMICASSGLAIVIVAIVTLWVCCKINRRTKYKKQESLSALTTLMQEPGSPEVKKPAVTDAGSNKEYAHLVSYSIVIDVKSTV